MDFKTLNKNLKIFLLISLIISVRMFAQSADVDSSKFRRLQLIYKDLEYNTIAFNDLKNTWVVTDPIYIREIFNRFIVKDALTINGKLPTESIINKKIQDIYNGDVFIELRKRYYDDEIEEIRFFTESKLNSLQNITMPNRDYFFDPISDYIFIKNVLGDKIYEDLKKEFYSLTDLTKETYGNKEAYNFDINLNLFDSELMFWTQTTNSNNKYLVSIFEKWGSDQIILPGWYYSDVFLGLKVSYVNYLRNSEPYTTYYLELGSGVPVKNPTFEFKSDSYGPKLYDSGINLYVGMGAHPFSFFSDKLEVNLSTMYSLNEYDTKKFGLNYVSQFYSNRNFINILFKYNDIMNVINFGWLYGSLGYSNYNIVHYLYNPEVSVLKKIADKNYGATSNMLTARFGIDNYSGLFMYDFAPMLTYNFNERFGYAGFKLNIMLNNIIGFDLGFYSSFGISNGNLPIYRESSYIIFSPTIRINY